VGGGELCETVGVGVGDGVADPVGLGGGVPVGGGVGVDVAAHRFFSTASRDFASAS
jgi:hypothetical protein